MKFTFIVAILLVAQSVITIKKGVKTLNAKIALARQADPTDNLKDDMDIHKLVQGMANHQALRDEAHVGFPITKANVYLEAVKAVTEQLETQKPVVVDCAADSTSCDSALEAARQKAATYYLYMGQFVEDAEKDLDKFSVYAAPICNVISLPKPYLENKMIKTCLSASSSAKRIAEKSVKQMITGALGTPAAGKFNKAKKYRCKHMLMDGNGGHKLTTEPCVDLNAGTNLVECFFEVHAIYKFSMQYDCFLPALWRTWFDSFKRVYYAMKSKGYAVTTDNLQSRKCYLDTKAKCAQYGSADASWGIAVENNQPCGKDNNHNYCRPSRFADIYKHCVATKFAPVKKYTCMNFRESTKHIDFQWYAVDEVYGELYDRVANPTPVSVPAECSAEKQEENTCLVTYDEFCAGNQDPASAADTDKANAWAYLNGLSSHNDDKNLYCSNISEVDGYSPNWPGLYCGEVNADSTSERLAEWAACSNDYPLTKIEELLRAGADTFPKVEFEKRTPSTMIMVGFDQQCKKPYSSVQSEWQKCLNGAYDAADEDKATDAKQLCTQWTREQTFKCLYENGNCAEFADPSTLTGDANNWWAPSCGANLVAEGKACALNQFKEICLREKWNGWNFNTGNASADYNGDGIITDDENRKFHLDMAADQLLGAIGNTFDEGSLEAMQHYDEGAGDAGEMGQDIIDQESALLGTD